MTISTDAVARDGNVWLPAGCDLTDYRKNPIVLWQHQPDEPIGTASNLRIVGGALVGRIKFAPAGVSAKADTARGLMKAGVLCGISAGIEAIDVVPIDATRPRGGQKIIKWSLLEISAVSIPADTGAGVTARAHPMTRKPGPPAPHRATDPGLPARLAALDDLNRAGQRDRRAAIEAGGPAGVAAYRAAAAADAQARSAAYPRPQSRAERMQDLKKLEL